MADGYGAGLFDEKGPANFAAAIAKISDALTRVRGDFGTFGSSATGSIGQVSDAVDALIAKINSASGSLSQVGGAPGGGGPGGGAGPQQQGPPQPQQGGIPTPPQWQKDAAQPANPNTGQGNPLAGMQQGTASTMGQRAIQSMLPAAIGTATNVAQSMVGTAIQGATVGQLFAPEYGVTQRSQYVIPQGVWATSPGQYAQTQYFAASQMGLAPGTAGAANMRQGAQGLMTLLPGLQTNQAYGMAQNMIQPGYLQGALAYGFNFKPNGNAANPTQQFQQVYNSLVQRAGGQKPTASQVSELMAPGAPFQFAAQQLGWDQQTQLAFWQFATTEAGLKPGQQMPTLGTLGGAKQTPLGNTSAFAQAQAQYAQSGVASQAEPALAQAATLLNEAAKGLLQAVNPIAGVMGGGAFGGGGVGTVTGGLSTLGTLGTMYIGGKVATTAGRSMLRGIGGKMPGKLGNILVNAGTKKSGGLLGRLGGLFGRGGGAAAGEAAAGETAAEVGGLETAGLTLDATGVGAPIGIGLGIAGAAIGFGPSIARGIGSLFGHKKKSTAAPDGTQAGGVSGDVASLLSAAPPNNSVIAALTNTVNKGDNTLISALLNPPPAGGPGGQAGGGIAGAAAALGGGGWLNAQGGGIGGVSGWQYKSQRAGLVGATLPSNLTSTGGSSSSSSNTGSSQTVTPTGGTATGTAAQNAALGQQMAAAMGWTGAEWTALNNVAMQESGWSMTAQNPTSSAYGIAQFINGPSEYATYGGDSTTAKGQITAFLNYIKQRYGTPTKAWQHEQQYNWYARGSQLIDRTQLALLHRGEAVIPAADNYSSSSYNKNGASGGGSPTVHLNFKAGSVVLQVPASANQQDMETMANQFVAAIAKPQVLAAVRST